MLTALIKPESAKASLKEVAAELTEFNVPQFDLILDKGTSLSVISASRGKPFTIAAVAMLIVDMTKAYNVGRPMTEDQAVDLAEEIVADYFFVKLEDVCAFCSLCRKGKYGKVFDRLDPGVFYEWWAKYIATREDHVMRKNYDYSYEQPAERKEEEAGLSNASFAISTVKEFMKKNKYETDKKHPANQKK